MKNKLTELIYNLSILFRTLTNILIIVIFIAILIINLNILNSNVNIVKYDFNKAHHGENSFKSISSESFWQWLKMLVQEGNYPVIDQANLKLITVDTDLNIINSTSDLPRATWIGHSTVLVQYQNINFLTDPHLSERPAPIDFLVPKRFTPPALSYQELPKIDFIIISHNHYDHLDHHTVDMFGNSVIWYIPLGLKSWFLQRGIYSENIVEFDWWQSHKFNQNVKITFTPTIHWSRRSLWDKNQSLWGSWSVKIENFNIWFGGDTAYDEDLFKEIGQRIGPFQLSFIPIGAYSPKYFTSKQHVDPAQAVLIHKDINSEKSIPIHWGTFQLTHEPLLEPLMLLEKAIKSETLSPNEFKAMKIGETVILQNTDK